MLSSGKILVYNSGLLPSSLVSLLNILSRRKGWELVVFTGSWPSTILTRAIAWVTVTRGASVSVLRSTGRDESQSTVDGSITLITKCVYVVVR